MSGSGWGMVARAVRQIKRTIPAPHFLRSRTDYAGNRPRKVIPARLVPRRWSRARRHGLSRWRAALEGFGFLIVLAFFVLLGLVMLLVATRAI